jgi:hypothetical protein
MFVVWSNPGNKLLDIQIRNLIGLYGICFQVPVEITSSDVGAVFRNTPLWEVRMCSLDAYMDEE